MIRGQFVDVRNRKIFPAEIIVEKGRIKDIKEVESAPDQYILPGFVDAHIHIESSMLTPSQFATIVVKHGTIGTVSDPHEIANVCGVEGVHYMINSGLSVPLKFHFGAPSCVPATHFETAGAIIGSEEIKELMSNPHIYYLSEVMNFPAVINDDEEILAKMHWAKFYNKPIDGHAPGLSKEMMAPYFTKGISTDHECTEYDEAVSKIAHGVKILIREGSAAKNFEALVSLFESYPNSLMFCSDDLHPDDLQKAHINALVSRAIEAGYDPFNVWYAATIHPVEHYRLDIGTLQIGDNADFILVDDWKKPTVLKTIINGEVVYDHGKVLFQSTSTGLINQFNIDKVDKNEFIYQVDQSIQEEVIQVKVIEALDGQLMTNLLNASLKVADGEIKSDVTNDILKIAVINRYHKAEIAIGFIKNFGLNIGALASTVAHDSHNIVVVGVDDASIADAANLLIESKGGISLVDATRQEVLPLPIGGLMSEEDPQKVAYGYEKITQMAKENGCVLHAPFMTLSFMALPVIPRLKMTDKGLFDTNSFQHVSVLV